MKYLKIFTDFLEVVEPLSDDERGRLFMAMLGYALDGSQPTLTGNERFVWAMARQHIDREAAAYESMVEARREAGRRGADARWQKMAKHGKNGQDKDNDKEKEKDKEEDKDFFSSGGARLAAEKKIMPPTMEEVMTFSQETGLNVDARLFFDYYEANGWYIGKMPMKDWQAAFRAWARNAPTKPGPVQESSVGDNFKKAMEMLRMEEAKLG